MNLEKEKENFKNHIARFTDYGNIKILDFKDPNSINYRIRFLFEEDYCRCHISGDLGELIATNYNNMTYDRFKDFVRDIEYFKSKIDCHNRAIYHYDEGKAREDILEYLKDYDFIEEVETRYDWENEEENIEDFLSEVLEDFSDERGIGSKGYDVLSAIDCDVFESVEYFGREETGILELYMLAFELATEQLKCSE